MSETVGTLAGGAEDRYQGLGRTTSSRAIRFGSLRSAGGGLGGTQKTRRIDHLAGFGQVTVHRHVGIGIGRD